VDAEDIYLAKAAPEKIEQHLKRPIDATIGTLNSDGSIHLAFGLFLWEDGPTRTHVAIPCCSAP
jgi:hypothetical protein